MSGKILIIGASLAGVSAAEALRNEGFDGHLALLGDEAKAPYGRPPLSKQILEGVWEPDRAILRTPAELASLDVELIVDRATGLDGQQHRVLTEQGSHPYDALIIATGAFARRPHGVPGIERVRVLRTMEDAVSLRDGLGRAHRIAVLGAGILASEIVSAARHAGLEAVLIGRSGQLSFGALGTRVHDRLAALHNRHGVHVRTGETVRAVHWSHDGASAHLELDGSPGVTADLVTAAIGSTPQTQWLHGSGLTLADGVMCDDGGRAMMDVYAIGDVARWADPASGTTLRIEHQFGAIEQAHRVARTIMGRIPGPPPLPFFWSQIHGTRIQAYGIFPASDRLSIPESDGQCAVLTSVDERVERVNGVLGWNSPRAFRSARALVDRDRLPVTA